MKKLILPLIIFSLIGLSMTNNSGRGFNYQAVARTIDGQVKANQEIELQFSLYPGQQAQTPSWQEVHRATTNPFGIFNVIVGKGEKSGGFENSFADINFAIADFWLKVEVKDNGSWQEISNTQLYSSPYTEVAHNAQAAPVGSILPFAGPKEQIPDGWLLCDGKALSRSDFATLYEVIGTAWGHGDGANTFYIPDLRGLFLRGVSYGAGHDPDKNDRRAIKEGGNTNNEVGSLQIEAFKSHNHSGKTSTAGNHSHKLVRGSTELTWQDPSRHDDVRGWTPNIIDAAHNNAPGSAISAQTAGNHQHNIPADGTKETRPDNAYINYIIKY